MTLDLRTVTADQAIDAMMTVEGLRVEASSLHTGDRIVYREHGGTGYRVATVHSVTGAWSGRGGRRNDEVTIATDQGDVWSCSARNRGQLRIVAESLDYCAAGGCLHALTSDDIQAGDGLCQDHA